MKKIITLLALTFSLNGKAQYVTIPDVNFATYLQSIIPSAMNGNQMYTTSILVTTTTQTINVSNKNISDLTGITYFKSLQSFDCSNNNLTIKLPSLAKTLKYLNCGFNLIWHISSLPDSLVYLNMGYNSLDTVPNFPNSLKTIICFQIAPHDISLPTLPDSLVSLDCSTNFIYCLPTLPSTLTSMSITTTYVRCIANYPPGLIITADSSLTLCGSGNLYNCAVSPTCTSSAVSYSLVADAAPHTWDAYPTYPANVDSAIWYWGDGTSTTGLYPSHTYSVADKYNICVYVIASGCSSGYCQNDSVYRLSNNNTLSNMVYVNVLNSAAGIKQILDENYFTIYPNPASDQFHIETNATDKLNVDLYDVNSRHVFSANVSDKGNINVAPLDNGAYTLTIKTADRLINKKLVIIH